MGVQLQSRHPLGSGASALLVGFIAAPLVAALRRVSPRRNERAHRPLVKLVSARLCSTQLGTTRSASSWAVASRAMSSIKPTIRLESLGS